MGIRRWMLQERPRDAVERLAAQTGLPYILCDILSARGYADQDEIERFLSREDELEDPFALRDMDRAVERIAQALETEEQIAVYGDYDCDGITSTALLTSYLQSVGGKAFYFVPSRERDGYGMNKRAVEELAGMNVSLIITVDNGISAHEEIDYAGSLGIDVVVTDHHTPRDTLPNAVAVVNPHRADCPSAYKDLAGVGVAFKLVCALEDTQGGELLEYYSDLAALGTVADVVPLTGENRIIVRHGLRLLMESERPGIQALLEVAGLTGKALTGESVAFGLAPRINAAGRMDCADDALELLLTDDPVYAAEIAASINAQNEQRKKIEEQMLGEIEGMLRQNPQILNQRILVVSGRGWHHGVVGIVAAKLMEKHGVPVILFSIDGDEARGSGRSVDGFSLIKAISACSGLLTRYGGHTLAAGLSLRAGDLPAFTEELLAYAKKHHPRMPVPVCRVDGVLAPKDLALENIRELSRLEPFGCANEQPVFLLPGLTVDGLFPTNDKKHLRIRFLAPGGGFTAVYFRMTEQELPCRTGQKADVLAALSAGEYNGKPQLSVRIRDLRPAGMDQERVIEGHQRYRCHLREEYGDAFGLKNEVMPDRDDLALVYKYIRRCGDCPFGPDILYLHLLDSGIDYCKLLVALDVLVEMGLVQVSEFPRSIRLVPDAGKVDLARSGILQALRT